MNVWLKQVCLSERGLRILTLTLNFFLCNIIQAVFTTLSCYLSICLSSICLLSPVFFSILSNLFDLNTDKNLGHCDKVLYHQSLLLFQHCPEYYGQRFKVGDKFLGNLCHQFPGWTSDMRPKQAFEADSRQQQELSTLSIIAWSSPVNHKENDLTGIYVKQLLQLDEVQWKWHWPSYGPQPVTCQRDRTTTEPRSMRTNL